jgi:hypothetical protein
MRLWSNRSIEEKNLLNPAFCCVALTTSVIEYQNLVQAGMPYDLPLF